MYFCALPFLRLKCHLCHLYILLKRNSCEMIRALPCRVRFRQKVSYHWCLYPAPGNNVTAAPALPEGADTVAGSGMIRVNTALYMTAQCGFIPSPVKTLTSKLYIKAFLSSRKIFYPTFPQYIHRKMWIRWKTHSFPHKYSVQNVDGKNFFEPNMVAKKLSTFPHYLSFNISTYPQIVHNLWISYHFSHIFM